MPFCVSVTRVGCSSVCDQAATLVTSLSHPSVNLPGWHICHQGGMSVTSLIHLPVCLCPGWHIHAGLALPSSCLSLPHVPSPSTPVSSHVPAAPACTVTPRITCCHPGDWDILMQWPCSYVGSGGCSLPRELWSRQELAVPQDGNGDEVTRGSLSLLQVL